MSLLVNILMYSISFEVISILFFGGSKLLDVKIHLNGINILLAIIILACTYIGIQSQYVLVVSLLFATIAQVLVFLTERGIIAYFKMRNHGLPRKSKKLYKKPAFYAYYVGLAPLVLWATYLYHIVTDVFIPITGKSGAGMNPDIIVGIAGSVLLHLVLIYFVSETI